MASQFIDQVIVVVDVERCTDLARKSEQAQVAHMAIAWHRKTEALVQATLQAIGLTLDQLPHQVWADRIILGFAGAGQALQFAETLLRQALLPTEEGPQELALKPQHFRVGIASHLREPEQRMGEKVSADELNRDKPAVMKATRLAALAPAGEVLISREVWEHLPTEAQQSYNPLLHQAPRQGYNSLTGVEDVETELCYARRHQIREAVPPDVDLRSTPSTHTSGNLIPLAEKLVQALNPEQWGGLHAEQVTAEATAVSSSVRLNEELRREELRRKVDASDWRQLAACALADDRVQFLIRTDAPFTEQQCEAICRLVGKPPTRLGEQVLTGIAYAKDILAMAQLPFVRKIEVSRLLFEEEE
jgi:hypothetical protein